MSPHPPLPRKVGGGHDPPAPMGALPLVVLAGRECHTFPICCCIANHFTFPVYCIYVDISVISAWFREHVPCPSCVKILVMSNWQSLTLIRSAHTSLSGCRFVCITSWRVFLLSPVCLHYKLNMGFGVSGSLPANVLVFCNNAVPMAFRLCCLLHFPVMFSMVISFYLPFSELSLVG